MGVALRAATRGVGAVLCLVGNFTSKQVKGLWRAFLFVLWGAGRLSAADKGQDKNVGGKCSGILAAVALSELLQCVVWGFVGGLV